MIQIGALNQLEIIKDTPQGFYLRAGYTEVLLPNKYIPSTAKIGDVVEVFLYTDSEDRIIATTLTPYLFVNEFATLKVEDVTSFGAFLDMGLEKQLFVPKKEQRTLMQKDESYVVFMYLDEISNRLVGSSQVEQFLDQEQAQPFTVNQSVEVLVYAKTPLGYNVIIEGLCVGILYYNEVFKSLNVGDFTTAYVKKVREDHKVDLSLSPLGFEAANATATELIEEQLKLQGGVLELSDQSSPELIYKTLGLSKKAFKKAIGTLYKEGKIRILDTKIEVV